MTYNGANGTTKTGMAHALALNEMGLEELNQGSQALLHSLSPPSPKPIPDNKTGNAAAQLAIANSLWLKREDSLLPDFVQRAQQLLQRADGPSRWSAAEHQRMGGTAYAGQNHADRERAGRGTGGCRAGQCGVFQRPMGHRLRQDPRRRTSRFIGQAGELRPAK